MRDNPETTPSTQQHQAQPQLQLQLQQPTTTENPLNSNNVKLLVILYILERTYRTGK